MEISDVRECSMRVCENPACSADITARGPQARTCGATCRQAARRARLGIAAPVVAVPEVLPDFEPLAEMQITRTGEGGSDAVWGYGVETSPGRWLDGKGRMWTLTDAGGPVLVCDDPEIIPRRPLRPLSSAALVTAWCRTVLAVTVRR